MLFDGKSGTDLRQNDVKSEAESEICSLYAFYFMGTFYGGFFFLFFFYGGFFYFMGMGILF